MYKAANIVFFSHSEVKGTQIFARDKEIAYYVPLKKRKISSKTTLGRKLNKFKTVSLFYFIPRFFNIGSS